MLILSIIFTGSKSISLQKPIYTIKSAILVHKKQTLLFHIQYT